MNRVAYLNGAFVPCADAFISVDDRGFLFGDGVYEVTRAVNGVLFEVGAHLERLDVGLAGLEIPRAAVPDAGVLLEISHRLLVENGLLTGDATVYLQVTRGAAVRTHQFPAAGTLPTVYLSASRHTRPVGLQERGTTVITHPDLRWRCCNLKTVNLVPNVLAKQRAVAAGATEAVLVREGVVTEGSHTNVFGVIRGEIRTHPCTEDILSGVTRGVVLQLAREADLVVRERPMRVEELAGADELFLCGTTIDVMPVTKVDGSIVGSGRPGPVTRALQRAFAERMERVLSSPTALSATIP